MCYNLKDEVIMKKILIYSQEKNNVNILDSIITYMISKIYRWRNHTSRWKFKNS